MNRPLTASEIAALRPIFGEAIDYRRVCIHRGHGGNPLAMIAHLNGNPAIALGRHIHVRADCWRGDYSGDSQAFAAFIAHEVTHVWQWAAGRMNPARYLWQYWTWPGRGYDISGVGAEARFEALGYDQQAEVVAGYILALDERNAARAALFTSLLAQVFEAAHATFQPAED